MEDSRSKDFESIRPFLPEELPQVYDRLLSDPQFRQVVAYLYPDVPGLPDYAPEVNSS